MKNPVPYKSGEDLQRSFDDFADRLPPHSNDTTSREAAVAIKPHVESMSAAVFRWIEAEGGATAQELQHWLATPGDTIRPRIWELVKAGKVYDSGERKTLPNGRKAIIWRAR